jgi:hypothetical protein
MSKYTEGKTQRFFASLFKAALKRPSRGLFVLVLIGTLSLAGCATINPAELTKQDPGIRKLGFLFRAPQSRASEL